ncbi:hypothetical protein BDQ17DRAFT_1403847 [Cyathus striatus]|nr:hypothetical protein BDQ17DRAFT_1403847 [Cyathus striatus]
MSIANSLLFKSDTPLDPLPFPQNVPLPPSEGGTPRLAPAALSAPEHEHAKYSPVSLHTPLSEGHTPLNDRHRRTPLSEGHTAHSSPARSPRRLGTDPTFQFSHESLRRRVHKRIIVCCDGTWQDGISEHRSAYTNILRLSRAINNEDIRNDGGPPIQQIVFYQSGIGTEKNFYSEYIEATTGGSLADKVEEAYAFIAHNYTPGDEIFLFGFSRGAYTARMVATFIGEIGVLDRKDMDHFAGIFIAYQKLGKTDNEEEKQKLREKLAPWNQHDSPGKKRADSDGDTFSVQCLGVFDTVGSLGLPEELTLGSTKIRTLFGFPDRTLGEHVKQAYQALALHEMRLDFKCNKFEQTEGGRRKDQVLKQCWFSGSHTDIGGGYREHDLADLTLVWMAANIENMLSLDVEYLSRLLQPVALWGEQKPHDSKTGIFTLASSIQREIPIGVNHVTNETIHSSVLQQSSLYPELNNVIKEHPELIAPLLSLEEELKVGWPYKPHSPVVESYEAQVETRRKRSIRRSILSVGNRITKSILKTVTTSDTGVRTETGLPVREKTRLGSVAERAGLGNVGDEMQLPGTLSKRT